MTMPEEINRIVTDAISDYLFVTEKSGVENLRKEGKDGKQIFFVGNIMIDTLHYCLQKLNGSSPDSLFFPPVSRHYAVVTLHRPSNVDDKEKLADILSALREISVDMPVFFPVHPRTQKNIDTFGLESIIGSSDIRTMPPKSYLEFLPLWKDASVVLTDSGGLQEETTALGVPCFTIRDNTERPITVDEGTNTLVGSTQKGILNAYHDFKNGNKKRGRIPTFWDGKAAERVVDIMVRHFKGKETT